MNAVLMQVYSEYYFTPAFLQEFEDSETAGCAVTHSYCLHILFGRNCGCFLGRTVLNFSSSCHVKRLEKNMSDQQCCIFDEFYWIKNRFLQSQRRMLRNT